MKSEIGVIYMNDFNRVVLEKEIKSHNLVFNELMQAEPHVFISRKHPLAGRSKVTMSELQDYPYLSLSKENIIRFIIQRKYFQLKRRKRI